MRRRIAILALAAAGCLLTLPAARADLLVTRQGATVETVGPWKVQGRMVVFTMPGGTLSSIRSDEVDLDRSAEATRRAAEKATAPLADPAAPKPPGEPIFRITDQDVQAVARGEGEGLEGELEGGVEGEPEEGERPEPQAASGPLEVTSWDRLDLPDGAGLELFGTVRNNGRESVVSPGVIAYVYGEGGGLLATSEGTVNLSTIPPGKTANFRAPFPGLNDFVAVKFDLVGRGYRVRGATVEDERGAEETGEEGEAIEEEELDPGAKYDRAAEPEPDPEAEPTDDALEAESEEPPPVE